jgi:hypothetical protein
MRVLMGIGAIGLTLMAVSADARVSAPPAEAAATRSATGAASEAAPCPLTLQFGSYAMGIDAGALSRIDALLARDRAVVHVDRQRWGREGEVTLCVHTRRSGDVQRIARAARRLVPTSPRGPVSAATPTGPLWTINQRGFGG